LLDGDVAIVSRQHYKRQRFVRGLRGNPYAARRWHIPVGRSEELLLLSELLLDTEKSSHRNRETHKGLFDLPSKP